MARVALVTGGTRGIGAAISRALMAEGYRVAATYAGNDAAAEAFTAETGVRAFKWNVADHDACKAGVAEVEAALGPVEVLVNNDCITRDAPFHKMTPQQWREVIDTNLTGLFNMTHAVWGGMRERKFGRVVNISSINGQKGQFAQANYAAAKAGTAGMTRALAREVASRGITVNCVAPGFIETDMTASLGEAQQQALLAQVPLGRLGRAEEVAHAVAYLVSEGAGYVTGTELDVNGGMRMG